ncbi:polymorphic toxin type 44 domain-containing protein [Streptomyces sp. NPDC056227]|uniref:polymorphic toxin type 44 domain-containing protein n=1 Tax=Streptomyces sp. NPDC056227 TaxID=3345753 RepID=UPI0035D89282
MWDHKPILREKYGLSLEYEEDLHLKIPGKDATLFYDAWSNIHYGFLGRAAGFTGKQLHAGAEADLGAATGKTDPGDVITVQAGIDMYDKYGADMTFEEFQSGMSDMLAVLAQNPGTQYQSTAPDPMAPVIVPGYGRY